MPPTYKWKRISNKNLRCLIIAPFGTLDVVSLVAAASSDTSCSANGCTASIASNREADIHALRVKASTHGVSDRALYDKSA
jgi:hypothetical protein